MIARPLRPTEMRPGGTGTGPASRLPLTRNLGLGLALVAACTGAAVGAGPGGSTAPGIKPAEIEIGEDGIKIMTLTPRATERIGVETVEIAAGSENQMIVPYAAGVYLPDGSTWVYVEIAEFTYRRAPIIIHEITGSSIVLVGGPDVGTVIVTSGVPELWGLEDGVGG